MTEAQKCLYHIAENMRMAKSISKEGYEYFQQAIKALEQQPCEDCVSREWLINNIGNPNNLDGLENSNLFAKFYMNLVKTAPSFAPASVSDKTEQEPKTGQWIEKYAEDACGERYSYWACSECGRSVGFNLANIKDVLSDYPYCHCGAKMVEPQESEDKESENK